MQLVPSTRARPLTLYSLAPPGTSGNSHKFTPLVPAVARNRLYTNLDVIWEMSGKMETLVPGKAFEALAHETRLAVFGLLIPAGREGMPAGVIGERLGLSPNSLSFHLGRLAIAGLVSAR